MISRIKLKGSKKVLWNKTNNKFSSKKGFADGLRWVGPAWHVCPELSPSLWDRAVTFSAALSQAHVSFLSTEGHLRETCMYVFVHTSLQIFSETLFLEILESLLKTKFWQRSVLFYCTISQHGLDSDEYFLIAAQVPPLENEHFIFANFFWQEILFLHSHLNFQSISGVLLCHQSQKQALQIPATSLNLQQKGKKARRLKKAKKKMLIIVKSFFWWKCFWERFCCCCFLGFNLLLVALGYYYPALHCHPIDWYSNTRIADFSIELR